MIKHVQASKDFGNDPQSFQSVIEKSVPLDQPAPVITFSFLASPVGKTFEVSEEQGHLVVFGADPYVVRAIGLQTCAAVCFVNRKESDNLQGYVYHALSGSVPYAKFGEIMKEIGVVTTPSDYRHVHVVYAYPKPPDEGYRKDIDQLHRWLYERATIVEIPRLSAPNFAMNQTVQVGY